MRAIARFLGLLSLVGGSLHFFRVTSARGAFLLLAKMVVGAAAPYLALLGALGGILGLLSGARLASLAAWLGAFASAQYIRRASAPHDDFERAFGADWEAHIPPDEARRMLAKRWSWRLPDSPDLHVTWNVPFWTIPGTKRRLLCDLWQPPPSVRPSGVAVIYLHGSGWHWMDKDMGTRRFFRHLAAQGHVVMDVAYRLSPETDLYGMVGDAKRAIVWMKRNAARYGANPDMVVLTGASAGGHIALLEAYAADHPAFRVDDVDAEDTTVRAVISIYPPADVPAFYDHTARQLIEARQRLSDFEYNLRGRLMRGQAPSGRPLFLTVDAMMKNMLGELPSESVEEYELVSPVNHVSPACPPTLLFHGEHDSFVPVEPTRTLYRKLAAAGVPVVYVEFPQTEHAFDLATSTFNLGELSQHSPPSQAMMYDVDRFLALLKAMQPMKVRHQGSSFQA